MEKNSISLKTVFSLSNLRHGWVNAHLSIGERDVSLHASYTPNDALGDFLQAITTILQTPTYISISHCYWHIEPKWYYWTFIQKDPLLDITVHILDRYNENTGDDLEMQNKKVFSATCGLNTFASKVRFAYRKLRDEYSEAEYQNLWHHPFPDALYAQLQSVLREREKSQG